MNKMSLQVQIERRLNEIIPKGSHPSKACMYWSLATFQVLSQHKIKNWVQAGSASFLFLRPEEDDGVRATHYSYEWGGLHSLSGMVSLDLLPKMHCWNAIESNGKMYLLDATTRFLPLLCKNVGIQWTAEQPPKWLWDTPERIPMGWNYRSENDAVMFAFECFKAILLREKISKEEERLSKEEQKFF